MSAMPSVISHVLFSIAMVSSSAVDACRPRVSSIAEHFHESDSVFLAKVVSDRVVCFDKEKYELEVGCNPNWIEVYPSIELTFSDKNQLKGENMPDKVVVGGCGYGEWSQTERTLVFARIEGGRAYAYLIPEHSERFKQALSEVTQMNQ